jgi:hypothetical protein
MTNQTLATKTMKIKSPKFHKVRMKLKIIDTDYTFFDKDGKEEKHTIRRGFVDNEKFTRSILAEEGISKESIDEIIAFLSTVYKMNLEELGV